MGLIVLGINHTTASIAIREKVAFTPDQMDEALAAVCETTGIDEVVILSTCNRTEIIASYRDDVGALAVEDKEEQDESVQRQVQAWLSSYHHVSLGDLQACSYYYTDADAVRHIMAVACGLNSMVLGEPQILGQMKSAYAQAREAGVVKSALSKVFQHTFTTAKAVRTRTAIGANPVSVAYAAVSLSQHIFSSLKKTSALLIGAGETIELVARHLSEQGVSRIIVANRTLERGQKLARQLSGEAILLSDIPDYIGAVDIVISSTASQLPILGKGMVERALKKRKHKPIFMVDIAVPRDIEPEVGELADVYLYTVDDLTDIIDENRKARESEALKADKIIDEAVEQYLRIQRSMDVVATLKAYREKAETLRNEELAKALKQLDSGTRPEEVLNALARGITNKLIHTPCIQMKQAASEGRSDVIGWTHELLGLELDQDGEM
jgi:glutamyl-tRNA reductase